MIERALSARFLPTNQRVLGNVDCLYNAHFTDSESGAGVVSHSKFACENRPLNHRKPDSSSRFSRFRIHGERNDAHFFAATRLVAISPFLPR
jgi:hypothetical protein